MVKIQYRNSNSICKVPEAKWSQIQAFQSKMMDPKEVGIQGKSCVLEFEGLHKGEWKRYVAFAGIVGEESHPGKWHKY